LKRVDFAFIREKGISGHRLFRWAIDDLRWSFITVYPTSFFPKLGKKLDKKGSFLPLQKSCLRQEPLLFRYRFNVSHSIPRNSIPALKFDKYASGAFWMKKCHLRLISPSPGWEALIFLSPDAFYFLYQGGKDVAIIGHYPIVGYLEDIRI